MAADMYSLHVKRNDIVGRWHIADVDDVHGEKIGRSGEQLLKNGR